MTDCDHTFIKVGTWDNGVVAEICTKCRAGKGIFADAQPGQLYGPDPRCNGPTVVRYWLAPKPDELPT